jgi:hypothetical protein
METLYTAELNSKGYTIIDNVLPLDIAKQIYQAYQQETNWDLLNQVRESHYSHVFESTNPFLPQKGEIYSAKFSRSNSLESSELIQNTF